MTRAPAGDLALVAAGAAAGALVRWTLSHTEHGSSFPWVTLVINVVGAFLLGALPAVPVVRRSHRATLLLGPGLLGGFTTVSAWAGQVNGLVHDGRETLAGVLVVATVVGALVSARLGRHVSHRPEPEDALT